MLADAENAEELTERPVATACISLEILFRLAIIHALDLTKSHSGTHTALFVNIHAFWTKIWLEWAVEYQLATFLLFTLRMLAVCSPLTSVHQHQLASPRLTRVATCNIAPSP